MKKLKKVVILLIVVSLFIYGPAIYGQQSTYQRSANDSAFPLDEIKIVHEAALQTADINYKIAAIQQMAKLKKKESVEVLVTIMNQAIDVIDPTRPDEGTWKWAAAAARAARSFARVPGAVPRLTPPLTKMMRYHPEERVQGEAALSLGVVAAHGDDEIRAKAASALTEKLDKCPIVKNLLALLLVKALGRLGHRRAFVSLLAVTQKGFLDIVKQAAKKSLKMLRF